MNIETMINYCQAAIEILGTSRSEKDDLANKPIESDVYTAILAKLQAAEVVLKAKNMGCNMQVIKATIKDYEDAGKDVPG